MLSQPAAEQQQYFITPDGDIAYNWEAVRESTWFKYSPSDEAQGIAAQARTDLAVEIACIDGLGVTDFVPVRYLDPKDQRMWVIQGVTTQPDGKQRLIQEYCGSLEDRKTNPTPGDDPGGTKLVARPASDKIAQLFWEGQAPSTGMLGKQIVLPDGRDAWLPGPDMNQSTAYNGMTFTQDGVQYVVTVDAANQPPWPPIYSTKT